LGITEQRVTKTFLLIVLLSGVVMASAATTTPTVTAPFKQLLVSYGLGHLSPEDMAKVEGLLNGMNKAAIDIHSEKVEAFDSIEEYMQEEGFKPDHVFVTRCRGKEALVVGKRLREFTTDIPTSLNTSRLRSGAHFVRSTSLGVSHMIAGGKVHDFRYSDWQSFYSCR
jgi:hypothetical protein